MHVLDFNLNTQDLYMGNAFIIRYKVKINVLFFLYTYNIYIYIYICVSVYAWMCACTLVCIKYFEKYIFLTDESSLGMHVK